MNRDRLERLRNQGFRLPSEAWEKLEDYARTDNFYCGVCEVYFAAPNDARPVQEMKKKAHLNGKVHEAGRKRG